MQQSKVRPSSFASALADEGARNVAYQVFAAVAIGTALFFFTANTVENLTRLGIASGFGFLGGMAGYDVSEGFIAHSSRSTVGWIFLVGLLNTLYISSIGIVLATILGVLIGIARVSPNWIMAKLSAAYIELFRNTPMLLQIAFWYALVRQLPLPRQAFNPTPGIFLSTAGSYIHCPYSTPRMAGCWEVARSRSLPSWHSGAGPHDDAQPPESVCPFWDPPGWPFSFPLRLAGTLAVAKWVGTFPPCADSTSRAAPRTARNLSPCLPAW